MILFKISLVPIIFALENIIKKLPKVTIWLYTVIICTILKNKIIQVNAGSVNTTIAWPQ